MDDGYRRLWIAVLEQAIIDVQKYIGSVAMEKAQMWFQSDSEDVGSFLWICIVLDLNPESIKH